MKKYAVLLLLLSSCAAVGTTSKVDINENFPHDEIQKIAVIMFEAPVDMEKRNTLSSKMSIDANAGEILASMTARELAKLGKYVVVNRKAVEEALKLKKLKEEDLLQAQNYLNLGKQLGVDAIVVGKIERFGVSYSTMSSVLFVSPLITKISFIVRCVDVITNETIWTVKVEGDSAMENERALASRLISETFETLKARLN
ncbi:MAG: CsgG/HfaB family protein [Candidatus Scalindua rubra]|uniref:Curli production assembly/transport component CsgG n=1 Tax=Candidatus Scalindua brodae TaxID=237368 RepID=A0A0B0ECL7_9BACT|nr:MAG: hypothetical protein SCABRO_03268 [Candidatus Scalindua brodae]MBZ0109110.1 CsgG/HfaB family protein [Candidatus Scalindua rubra]TWU33544.1 Curli production assembly/transport component CsgG [Candidatus Brocadiaceae bacterium S225]